LEEKKKMNMLHIIGNLCNDPQLRTTQNGKTVCTFTVAVNRRHTANAGQPEADFFRVSAWNELGTVCQKWLIKGRKVCVVGPVSVSAYTAQNGEARGNLDVFAQTVEFLSPANQAPQAAPQTPVHSTPTAPKADNGFVQVDDEEIPF
jgi:single-strand DNA-binding protein